MALTATWNPSPAAYTPANDRMLLATLFAAAGSGGSTARPGVVNRSRTSFNVTTGVGQVSVAAGQAVVVRAAPAVADGAWVIMNDAAAVVALSAADPTNARIDVIYLKVTSTEFGDGTVTATLEKVTGTPAGSPAVPAIPAATGTLKLAEVLVAASTGNQTVTDSRTWTGVAGLPRILSTESLPLTTTAAPGSLFFLDDLRRVAFIAKHGAGSTDYATRYLQSLQVDTFANKHALATVGDVLVDSSTNRVWRLNNAAVGWTLQTGHTVLDAAGPTTPTAAQSFTTSVFAPIQFPTSNIALAALTNTNTRFTPTFPGWYQVTGRIAFAANATGFRYLGVAKNGTRVRTFSAKSSATGNTDILTPPVLVNCNGTSDYVELHGMQDSGGNLAAANAAASEPVFTVTYAGPG